jgi:hypothetical protein
MPTTWVNKIKRAVDGSILKLQSWFCVRGDQQDIRYEDGTEPSVYAPVVQWSTIGLVFNLMIARVKCVHQDEFDCYTHSKWTHN